MQDTTTAAERIATFYTKQVERNERLIVGLVLAAYLVALGWQAWHVGLTLDEPTRMLASYLYWLNQPDLSPRDLPPLIKILTGWIPLVLHIPLFPELPCWKPGITQDVASEILDRLQPAQIQEVFYLMRLVLSTFAVLTALLVWYWGRLLFGRAVGLLLLLTAVLSPTALAHGCLANSDLAATFGYLLSAFCAWRFWLSPSRKTALALGASVTVAMLAKMSMLIVPILALLVVAARAIRGPRPLSRWLGWALGAVLLVPYAGTVTAYKFDTRRLTAYELEVMHVTREFPEPLLKLASIFQYIPTPADMQDGIRSLSLYQEGGPSYMLGKVYPSGHWVYYPVALAVKTPIAIQILFVGGLILVARRMLTGRTSAADWFLVAPGFLYLGLAIPSNLQLGVRLVLPCFPFGFIVAGFAIERGLSTGRGKIALAVVFGWLAVASIWIYPQGLAYFNEWAGGPDQGWRYLVDSNLDWGQDLPELADYVRENGLRRLKLFYFGFDKLDRYGVEKEVEMPPVPWDPALVTGTKLIPTPGIYAVSATLLPGHYFLRDYWDYFRYFREREPDDEVGYSILIYKVKRGTAPRSRAVTK